MGHALTEQRFSSYEDIKNGTWQKFHKSHKLPKIWEKCITSNGT
jgi:hypothetical protein